MTRQRFMLYINRGRESYELSSRVVKLILEDGTEVKIPDDCEEYQFLVLNSKTLKVIKPRNNPK